MTRQRNPTELIIAWLGDGAMARAGTRSTRMIREGAAGAVDARDALAEIVMSREPTGLHRSLDMRGRDESALHRLRADLAKYASQHAPREIGHLKGLVDWSIGQVDWQEVGSVSGDPGAPPRFSATTDLPNWEQSILRHEMDAYRMEGPTAGSPLHATPHRAA